MSPFARPFLYSVLAMRPIPAVYLLHASETGDNDLACKAARILGRRRPEVPCHCPAMPFTESNLSEAAIAGFLQGLEIPPGSLLVGFELGGFVAAHLQSLRPDLGVFAIHAPASVNGIGLPPRLPHRYVFYSLAQGHRQGSEEWKQFAEAYDVPWVYIQHMMASLISAYLFGGEVAEEVERRNRYLTDGARPRGPVPTVYLLHGKGGSPGGSVLRMKGVLARHWPDLKFQRPLLPHSDPQAPAQCSVDFLRTVDIPRQALVIGISLGGIVAAGFQEQARPDLQVISISAPTWTVGLRLERWLENRVAIYSSRDPVIGGRTADWPKLAQAYEFAWLGHDTDPHLKYLVRLIDWYLEGRLAITADRVLDVPRTKQEAAAERQQAGSG